MSKAIELREGDQALAVIHPELGGWLTRYARNMGTAGWIEAFYSDPAIVARYPDRMWAGNPVLFPHVSYNVQAGKEGAYALDGKVYLSPQHGFARRVPWQIVEQGPAHAVLELRESALSLPSYPFSFVHRLTYRLQKGRLTWEQQILNRGEAPMPFTTGFHPYLPVPLTPRSQRNQCHVRLPACRRYKALPQASGFTSEVCPAQNLNVATDVSEAWFLGDFAERQVALVDPLAGLQVVVDFSQNPAYRFLALWSRSDTEPFYCVEPWTGLPNSFSRPDGERIWLSPGEEFRAILWMDVLPA